MKRTLAIIAAVSALMLFANAGTALAKGKEVTITGEAKCAKCMLHEGSTCQTVIQAGKGRKTQTYYVSENDVSKSFHADVCHKAEKVTATGTVKKVDNKKEMTLSKIEAAK